MRANPFNHLDVVALLADVPERGLVRGQVGTVLDVYDNGDVEVEFNGEDGRLYALLALRPQQVLRLYYRPAKVA